MKKLFTTGLLALATIAAAQAQTERFEPRPAKAMANPYFRQVRGGMSPLSLTMDTLEYGTLAANRPCSDSLVFYNLAGGNGAASGTNRSGFKEFGQKFRRPGVFRVIGALVATNLENATGPDVFVNAYTARFTRVGTVTFIDTATRKQSDPTPLGQLTNNRYNLINFADTTAIFADSTILAVAIPDGSQGDTLNVFTTRVGCVVRNDAFTLRRGQRGLRPLNGLITGFNVDLGMLAIVEFGPTLSNRLKSYEAATEVHPLPARSEVMVVVPKNIQNAHYTLLTADGKQVRAGRLNGYAHTLERGGLANGVYMLRIATEAGPITRRVVFAD